MGETPTWMEVLYLALLVVLTGLNVVLRRTVKKEGEATRQRTEQCIQQSIAPPPIVVRGLDAEEREREERPTPPSRPPRGDGTV